MTKVLIVDDDAASRELISEVLTANGYAVGLVENAEAAQAALRDDETYRIVIADLRMPGGNGLQLIRALRAQNAKQEIILMSSFISGPERRMALDFGAAGLIEKPFRLSELLDLVAGVAREDSIGISS